MPKGTDDQVGFLAPQSKQIWMASILWHTSSVWWYATYLVGLLLLQLLENLLRLGLGSKCSHVDVVILEHTHKGLRCSRKTAL
jgi:hypothetical protein